MHEVFPVYKTDAHHSYASRDLIGIATSKDEAIALCHRQARKEHETLEADQVFNLANISQTQGYSGDGEFHFESITLNVLL